MDPATWLVLAAGVAGTWIGAELLVRGSARLALALGISPMVVGLTVVALGTSSPEAVASFVAASRGATGIAVGNVLGSNIANVGLILGAVCLIHPMRVRWTELRRDTVVMVIATLATAGFVFADALGRPAGIFLLLLLVLSLGLTLRSVRKGPPSGTFAEGQEEAAGGSALRSGILAAVGLVVLVFGADALVEAATRLGRDLGISEEIIGATVVAVGTSLPELAASLVAVARGHHDIGIGNIVGSNVMNLLFVLGGVCVLAPQPVAPQTAELLMPVALAFTLVLVPILRIGGWVGRPQAGLLLAGYLVFAVVAYV